MIKANSIDEVVHHLDDIINWSIVHKSRIGYFATLYRKMTLAVQSGINNHTFNDGKKMELLDIIFANRYLQAWEAYTNKRKCTNAWCAAFDACNSNKLIVLQHLIIGINTHINLDLGIAAAEASAGDDIFDLQNDFDKINSIIEALTQGVQDTLSNVWFPLRALTRIANGRHEAVLNFSITAARKASWANAVALAAASVEAKENYIEMMDNTVVKIANRILSPGLAIQFILQPVRIMESKEVPKIIEILKN